MILKLIVQEHGVYNIEEQLPPLPSAPNVAVWVHSPAPPMNVMDRELQTHLIQEGVSKDNVGRLTVNGFTQMKVVKLLSPTDIVDIGIPTPR